VSRASRLSIFRKLWPDALGLSHYLFAAVFLVRLVVLIRLASSHLLLPTGSDMRFYEEWAKQILQGHWTDYQAFYGLPLYPFLVALLYRIFGSSPFVPGFFQAGLDAGTAVLIYLITTKVLAGRQMVTGRARKFVGIIAAAAWCFFVPAQAYSAILMPAAGAVFMFWLLVWQIVRTEDAPSRFRCLVCGFLIGLTAMAVATILFLIPLFVWAIFMRQTKLRLAAKGTALALLFLGIFGGTSACWIHNYFVARDPVFLSAHGGINLWLGNNPSATGYPRFPGLHAGQGEMLRDSVDQAEAAAGRTLRRSEVSAYWSAKARAYIVRNPIAWLKLMLRKVANFWNAFEYDDLGVIANLLGHRILFRGPNFGVVAALALPGLLFSLRTSTTARWVAAAVLLHMAAILPVFVTERYRLAVVPGLCIFAAIGLSGLWNDCSLGRYRRVALYLLTLTGAVWLITLPRTDPALWAMRPYDVGREALESGDLARAEEQFARARAYAPDNAEINLALGNLRLAQQNRSAAFSFYSTVLRIDPAHKGALNNLGVMTLEDGKFPEAREYFRKALKQEHGNAKTYYLLAKAELALGNVEDAKTAIANALKRAPAQPEYRQLQEQIQQNGH
jgi:hypothetical protein